MNLAGHANSLADPLSKSSIPVTDLGLFAQDKESMVAIYVVSARDPLALAKAIEENQAKVKSSVVVLRDNQAIIDAFQARSIIFEERPRIESIDKSSSNAATFVVVELESATYSADRYFIQAILSAISVLR